ncbi:Tn3 family transposase [Streptomyces sp. NPDC048415]|uniref:Tn3 family transposase n=1 Tax=Streptomyces sp. NPDC048415 TaxID=3154822 RepID=UPI00341E370C
MGASSFGRTGATVRPGRSPFAVISADSPLRKATWIAPPPVASYRTLLLQDILSEEKWQRRLTDADRRALSPLFWTHVNPYGRFELDMNSHLALAAIVI